MLGFQRPHMARRLILARCMQDKKEVVNRRRQKADEKSRYKKLLVWNI